MVLHCHKLLLRMLSTWVHQQYNLDQACITEPNTLFRSQFDIGQQ